MNDELEELNKMKEEIETIQAEPFDPVKVVENSLYSFMEFRLNKLRKDMEFQDQIKQMMIARLSEVEFNDLRILLNQEQKNTNESSQAILNPFIPKVQEASTAKGKSRAIEEQIFEGASKENLQSFNEMFQFLESLKRASKKSVPDTDNIKKALDESVE